MKALKLITLCLCLACASCALNVSRKDSMTDLNWRVGLENATLLHGTASLPNDFDMTVGGDIPELLAKGLVTGGTQGVGIVEQVIDFFGEVLDFSFGWITR